MLNETPETNRRLRSISWETLEYEHKDRHPDWFWMAGLVGALGIIIAIVTLNFLFAVVILIATFTVMMYAAKKPEIVEVAINRRGVRVKNDFYPYSNIKSFAVKDVEEIGGDRLILHIDRFFLPHIVIKLEDADTEIVRDFLSEFLMEEPYEEPWIDFITERLGF